jgi:signal transduction histidine kinase
MLELSGVVLDKQKQQDCHNLMSRTLQIAARDLDANEILQEIVALLYRDLKLNYCLFIANTANIEDKLDYILKNNKECTDLVDYLLQVAKEHHYRLSNGDGKLWCESPSIIPINPQIIADAKGTLCDRPLSPLLLAPVLYRNNYYGIFALQNQDPCFFWQETIVQTITLVVNQYAIVCDRQRLQEENRLQQIRIQELEAIQTIEEGEASKRKLFIDNVTHELRTPLTSVIGFSHYLSEEIFGELNPKQKQYVNAINDSGKHLLEIVNDYLDISKIDADRESLFIERIVVEDICQASLSIVEALAAQSDIQLLLEIDALVDFCFADSMRLKQILVNLLSNAIKFTQVGTVTLRVELQTYSAREDTNNTSQITFSIIDTGIGISENDREKLFEPFQQLNNQINRYKKGSGLGLVLSQKLARLHGGDLTVTSELGKGSCFTVCLPLKNNVSD